MYSINGRYHSTYYGTTYNNRLPYYTSRSVYLKDNTAVFKITFSRSRDIKGLIVVPNAVNPANLEQDYRVKFFKTNDTTSALYDTGWLTGASVTDLRD